MKQPPTHEGLPASPHIEVAILGAMLLDGVAIQDAIAKLDAEDFSLDSHKRIFRAILSLIADGIHVDTGTVRERLMRRLELESIGGVGYLLNLTDGIPRNFNIESYVVIVKERAQMCRAMMILSDAAQLASDPSEDARTLIDRSIADLSELRDDHADSDILSVGEYLASQGQPETLFERMATVDGLPFGFPGLDEVIGGAQPGDLIIVAARPSMGKTAWACNVAQSIALRNHPVAFFSLEQKRKAMVRRMLSSSARVDYRDIRNNELRPQDRVLLMERRNMLAAALLYIDDTPSLTVSRIKLKCQRLQRRLRHAKPDGTYEGGLDIVLVDQLSKVSMKDCREKDFRLKIGEQTGALKRMAQELNVPVVVFNQLKRDADKRNPTPRLEDLKESGNIEEDADVVILLHRPEYYDKSDESLRGKGQMIVAKNREGETKTIDCLYQGRILRWEDDTPPPPAAQDNFYSAYRD